MSSTVKVLKSEKDAWNYAGEEGISEHSIMSGEVDYLEPHGKGKSFLQHRKYQARANDDY